MKKSLAITMFCLLGAVIIGLGAYAWGLDSRLERAGYISSSFSGGAMGEFAGALAELDETMRESRYATDPALQSTLCARAAAEAASAVTALTSLPYSTQELELLSHYLNGAGDYALYLSREAAQGRKLSEDELENLRKLGEAVGDISVEAGGIFAALDSGELVMDDYGAHSDSKTAGTVGYALTELDAALDEFPELDYAGAYSVSALRREGAYLKNMSKVGEEEARSAAARFLGVDTAALESAGRGEGTLSAYGFTLNTDDGQQRYITVSEAGGIVVALTGGCSGGEPRVGTEDAQNTAEELLNSQFSERFVLVSSAERGGLLDFTFAPEEDGVLLLPDTVEVSVDAATGELCEYNAANFLHRHRQREGLAADIDADTARSAVPAALKVKAQRLALTLTEGADEALCWEFSCENDAGEGVHVFVDAKTGRQVKIELTN